MRAYLIPARGGSRRIAGKNLVDLGGHPLLRWTVETAKEVDGSGNVYVTSDNDKILDVAEALGSVCHKRPAYLADDQATMREVVHDFFKSHTEITEVVLLYPTAPFRTAATVRAAVACYDAGTMSSPHKTLMSVREHRGRPFGGVQIIDGKLVFPSEATAYYRGQDTPPLYFANGAIFIINREIVDKLNTQLFCEGTVPFIMYGHENIDIDEPNELEVARALIAGGYIKVPEKWESLVFHEMGWVTR